jgi:hypothetical protein
MNTDHLVPKSPSKSNKDGRTTDKKLKRYLRRISDRKGISYKEAILKFYGVESLKKLDERLVHSLFKD